ncbi:MAG: M64 family metallopeptidase, partial [Prosthecobacter sp.]
MKTILLLSLFSVFAISALHAQTSTLVDVEVNGTRSTRLNIVFLPDGYTSGEMGKFATDVQAAVDYLFAQEPWVRYRSYCNAYRIEIASNESGTDNGSNGGPRDTYFQSGFLTGPISRLNTITSTGQSRAYALMNKHVPEYDIPVVIVNDPNYGGSGGPIAVATTNGSSVGLVEHEIGHSFADLADEYETVTPGYTRLEFANATSQTTLANIPWKIWIESGTPLDTPEDDLSFRDKVGHFQGANYRPIGSYRPHFNGLMRNLFQPPGSVVREAFSLSIYKKAPVIDSITPASLSQTFTAPAPLTLTVLAKVPSTAPALTVEWRHNDVTLPGETGTSLIRNTKTFGNGTHRIKAIVRDPTDWVRRDPTALVVEEVTWTLNLSNQTDPPIINTPLPATRVLPLGFTLMLDATATGPGPITYLWFKNNVAFKPAVTTPTLNVGPVSLTDAGTYTVKITNPGHTRNHSTVFAVLDPNVPRVVVGKGKTATLAFIASTNLPPVSWEFGVTPITNNTHYATATTKALQVKMVDVADTGSYFFDCGNFGPSPAVQLLVVTTKTDYTGMTPTLPVGIIGGTYNQAFPLPTDPLKTPNSFAGILPAGLKMDPKTGRISGIPTVASKDQLLGDEITFTVGNEFGKVPVKIRLLIKPLPPGSGGWNRADTVLERHRRRHAGHDRSVRPGDAAICQPGLGRQRRPVDGTRSDRAERDPARRIQGARRTERRHP